MWSPLPARLALLAVAASASATRGLGADLGLRDDPIASAAAGPTYLDGGAWTASSGAPLNGAAAINITVPATVPGDLLTDLQRAKVIADPWLDTTWIQHSSLWTDHAWTYTTRFTASDAVAAEASAPPALLPDETVWPRVAGARMRRARPGLSPVPPPRSPAPPRPGR